MSKSVQDFINEFVETVADDARERAATVAERLRERCQSPIEEIMAVQLYYHLCANSESNTFLLSDYEFGQVRPPSGDDAIIYAQATVGPYRADFLIDILDEASTRKFIVVECDGHDYHERTKEQAAKDRSRDRWMTLRGIHVMRFTGSEIWADPTRCAGEVEAQFLKLMGHW